MANPFPFVANTVLTADQLNQISDAVAFTPTFTAGLTVGNATQTWHYFEINDLILITGTTIFGSTTSLSTNPTMTLPINADTGANFTSIGYGLSHDSGTAFYTNFWAQDSTSAVTCFHMAANATFVTTGSATASAPMVWTTGDKIGARIFYRRA